MNIHMHIRRALGAIGIVGLCFTGANALAATSPAGLERSIGPGGVVMVNPLRGVARTFDVGVVPSRVATSGQQVWATSDGHPGVWLIDPRSGHVRRFANVAPDVVALAARDGRAYVLGPENIKVVDPMANPHVSTISLSAIQGETTLLTANATSVWGVKGERVFRIGGGAGPRTMPPQISPKIPDIRNEEQTRALTAIAIAGRSAWVIGDRGDRRVWQVGGSPLRIQRTVSLGFVPAGIVAATGGLWVTDQIGNRIVHVDPKTGRVGRAYRTGPDPVNVASGGRFLWVTSDVNGSIVRIDTHTGARREIAVHGTPTAVAVGRGRVFVAAAPRRPVPPAGGIRIGVVADCSGGFSFTLQQVLAGAELPLINRGAHLRGAHPSSGLVHATVAGHPVTLIPECEAWSDKTLTISALARLVERDHASIVLGPGFEGDSLAVRDFAHAHPHVTFMFTGFEQGATLRHHARNAYRFETDSVMWFAGLGTYARRTLGWNTATTVSNTDGSGWPSVQAFQAEFCSEGGHITPTHGTWVDVADGEQFGATLPTGVDGVFLPGGTPGPFGGTFNFVPRWAKAHPPVGQHLMVGWALLAPDPKLVGVVGGSSDPYSPTPAFNRYLAQYAAAFPNDPDPGLTNQSIYDAMEPVLEALGRVHGDLSNGQRRFRFALAHLRYHAPQGLITLDRRHQGIVPIYIAKVVRSGGSITVKQIKTIRRVDQTFGGLFSPASPPPSMTPACVAGNPPPWAN